MRCATSSGVQCSRDGGTGLIQSAVWSLAKGDQVVAEQLQRGFLTNIEEEERRDGLRDSGGKDMVNRRDRSSEGTCSSTCVESRQFNTLLQVAAFYTRCSAS